VCLLTGFIGAEQGRRVWEGSRRNDSSPPAISRAQVGISQWLAGVTERRVADGDLVEKSYIGVRALPSEWAKEALEFYFR
jgi:hypothetical protein